MTTAHTDAPVHISTRRFSDYGPPWTKACDKQKMSESEARECASADSPDVSFATCPRCLALWHDAHARAAVATWCRADYADPYSDRYSR